jgi:hypothetical protein
MGPRFVTDFGGGEMHSDNLMKYKILGAVLVLSGLFLVAKFELHLLGLVFIFVGFYLAMKKGMKPR